MFAAYFWHTDGWSPRNEAILEAVLKRAKATQHPCLIACDANMSPENFEKSLLVSERPNACDSTRRSVNVQIKKKKVYDYVIASNSLKGKDFTYECGGRFRIEATQGGYLCGRKSK